MSIRKEREEIIEEEDVQTLSRLGLTSLQARVYLTLAKVGKSTIKGIANTAKIDRADAYRVVAKLYQLGLSEKLISTPITYKATPIKDAVAILLQHKTQEYTTLKEKTEELVSNFQDNNAEILIEEGSQFLIISEKALLYKKLDEANKSVKSSIYASGKWEVTRAALFEEMPHFKSALKRGARIRWITETHKEDKLSQELLYTLQQSPLFEIKYFSPPAPLQTAIYDDKEVSVCIAMPPSHEITSIWSNNPVFVKLVKNYYEEIWANSHKDNIYLDKISAERKPITLLKNGK